MWNHMCIKTEGLEEKSVIMFQHGCRNMQWFGLQRLHGESERADRAGKKRRKGLQRLLTTDAIMRDSLLWRNVSAVQILNWWLWVPVHVLYLRVHMSNLLMLVMMSSVKLLPGYKHSTLLYSWKSLELLTTPFFLSHAVTLPIFQQFNNFKTSFKHQFMLQ